MSGLGNLTSNEMLFIALVLEGFFYGLYSAIFFMYMQYQASKELGIDKRNVVCYALCILYILSVVTVAFDITRNTPTVQNMDSNGLKSTLLQLLHLGYVSTTITGLCDFISQAILIYRCWVIWRHNVRVIIIPSILALIFLGIWLASNGPSYIAPQNTIYTAYWGYVVVITSLTISLTVNAVVTGLIVFRILKVYWEVKSVFEDRTLDVGGGNVKLRSIVFIIIESGMAMLTIQLIRVVLTILDVGALRLIIGINQMFNGITPTIILLRVSMGFSFYNEKSVSEIVESLCFQVGSDNENSSPETGVVETMGTDRIDVQQAHEIEVVDR